MPWYCWVSIGAVLGGYIVDVFHSFFTHNAWKAVKCMAEQNYELVKTLKEGYVGEDWTQEGEEWKQDSRSDE